MAGRRKLTIASFSSDVCCESFFAAVQGLGYEVHSVGGSEWLRAGTDEFTDPTVLLLSSAYIPRDQLISIVTKGKQSFLLGVCCHSDREWEYGVLKHCTDFLGWPCHRDELQLRLQRTFGDPQVVVNDTDETAFLQQFVDLNLLGESPAFVAALKLIKQFARCEAPVLIEGETGTGKELASRAIHYLSARRDHAFTPVNCGAIPDNLIENELFGHEKGAFTDAKDNQPGLVAEAQNGTLFLDEINTLSEKAQIALLRFLENQEYRSLGGKKTKQTNVRIITAANTRLAELVEQGRFRRDLFYRLNVLWVELPPLRERGSDIRLLVEYFLRQYSSQYGRPCKCVHPVTLEWMMRHPWPGNVRELSNLLHKEYLLCDGSVMELPEQQPGIDGRDARADGRSTFTVSTSLRELKQNVVANFEKDYLCWLMDETQGNISLAAKRAGTQRSALRRLLYKHGIDKNLWCASS